MSFHKICFSRFLITLGLLYQLLVIVNTRTNQISPIAFLFMGIGALLTFHSETGGKQWNAIGMSRMLNVLLFLAVAILSYNVTSKLM